MVKLFLSPGATMPRIHRTGPSMCRRYTSSPYVGTFKKLRAFRFGMTPEMAQRQMAKWSALLTGSNDKIISSALASFLPFVDYIRPIRFSAVYFPAWILNAEIEADVIYEKSQGKANAIFRNTYIPGSNVPMLSAASIWSQRLGSVYKPEPFSESLLEQHGEEVQCIPFTTSPFSVLDIAASANDSWAITQDLKVWPNSIKPTLFSAYPVLLPLYVAQYKLEKPEANRDTVTVVIQAHTDHGGIMTQRIQNIDELPGAAFTMLNDLGILKEFDLDSEVLDLSLADKCRVRVDSVSLRPTGDNANVIADWLDEHMNWYHNIEKLASVGQVQSDDDPRIREMTDEEQQSLDNYFSLTSEITMVKRIINAMSDAQENTMVLNLGTGKMPKIERADQASSTLKAKLQELEGRRTALKPGWWTEWEVTSADKN